MSNSIKVTFLGDDGDLTRASNSAERSTSRLGGTLRKVGAAAGLALGAGLLIGGKALIGMTKAAIEDEAAQVKLEGALRRNAGATDAQVASTERWITKQGKALGVTDDDLRPALGRLVTATKDVGKAQDLASLAMDVSAGSGKSLEQVSTALMKAQNGQVSSLSRLGINTKNAAGETITMEQATKRMAETFGGAAAQKANTLGGKMDRLKLIVGEAGETIGAKLIPKLTAMTEWFLSDGIPKVESFGQKLQKTGEILGKVAGFASEHKTALTALAAAIAAVVVITQLHTAVMAIQAGGGMVAMIRSTKIITSLTRAWAAVQWILNAALRANPIGIVITVLAALAVGLVLAYRKSETFRAVVDGAFRAIAATGRWLWENVLRPAFNGMKTAMQAVGRAGIWLWNNALQPAFRFIASGIAKVLSMWASMLRALGKVPGFGWATTAARLMQGAANTAQSVANNLAKIKSKSVTVRVNRINHTTNILTNLGLIGGRPGRNARGTSNWRGGATWVGEEGPELLDLPAGSRITPHRQSMARAAGGAPVVINFHGLVTDPRATAREIARLLREEKLLSGRELGIS